MRVYYSTTSERLARELQILLLRFGIIARLHAVGNVYGHPQWTVDATGVKDQRQFLDEIGVYGERGLAVVEARRRLDMMTAAGRFDTISSGVRERVARQCASASYVDVQAAVGSRAWGILMLVFPTRTASDALHRSSVTVSWKCSLQASVLDTITSSRYWASASLRHNRLETHNFIANGVNLHNSIEQDSDVVILLHREDLYERESPRAGEADLIVAKHRNGPTMTVTVAFQGHYSRFVDMAPG